MSIIYNNLQYYLHIVIVKNVINTFVDIVYYVT